MRAVILAPFRSDDAERSRNWEIARRFWEQMELPIVEGNHDGDEFQRAQARNVAAKNAGEWEVALFVDADIILGSLEQAEAALRRADLTGAYSVAYSHLHYLTEQGTLELEEGEEPEFCESDESVANTWECCFAVRRDIFDQVGGFDERFLGWGYQVSAFYYAYATFGGRRRIQGGAYHLSHPLIDRSKDPHFPANRELCEHYRQAVDDPQAMRELLKERAG
jgi:hypothetical protein